MSNETNLKILILNKLMFSDKITYSKLEKVTENHDLFNYHLKELLKDNYVEKSEKYYILTEKGKQFVSHMEEDGSFQKQFKVGMFIDVIRKENGKFQMLLHKRLKHPHYGYIGVVTGKMKWGQSLEENLRRELLEEVNIEVQKYSVLGVAREIFLNNESEVSADGVFFVLIVDEWKGDIRYESLEGEYFWCDIDKILDLDKIFRKALEHGIPLINSYLKDSERYHPYIIEDTTEALKY